MISVEKFIPTISAFHINNDILKYVIGSERDFYQGYQYVCTDQNKLSYFRQGQAQKN